MKNHVFRTEKNIYSCDDHGKDRTGTKSDTVLHSLVSGSLSSGLTTVIYQPLELVKTRIQLQANKSSSNSSDRIIGRTFKSATSLAQKHNVFYLWRGTGASLLRSIPGVGLYYASLNTLQSNFSEDTNSPDGALQAFWFGVTARSTVSYLLLPITVIKVRYESGQYKYESLRRAIGDAYLKNGWVGATPTILRDSLFSGIYYMCYTKLKSTYSKEDSFMPSTSNFFNGLMSGILASIITNPLDVLKTKIQVDSTNKKSMTKIAVNLFREKHGYLRFFDGLAPRGLRRALIAATTWSFYEFFIDYIQSTRN